jgi:hypothetical protein
MFFRRTRSKPATSHAERVRATGNRLAFRSGVLNEDRFPWQDDLVAATAEARKEHRPSGSAPSVVLEASIVIESLSGLDVPVLELEE